MKVLFLNGPPRCGKDTIGGIITEAVPGARIAKMAEALKLGVHGLYAGLNRVPNHRSLTDAAFFEDTKDSPHDFFLGLTPRQAYIAGSELLLKQKHGIQVFGNLLLEHMRRNMDVPLWVITDSGFEDEAWPIVQAYGEHRCGLVQIRRNGTSFVGDSRSYIELRGVRTLAFYNNSTRDDLAYDVRKHILGMLDPGA